MANIIRRSTNALWSNLLSSIICQYTNNLTRSIIKSRKRCAFFWLQDKYRAFYDENLTPQNEESFQQFPKEKYSMTTSPLKTEPWSTNETLREESARKGLIARKLGIFSMWTKDDRRLSTTCLLGQRHIHTVAPIEDFIDLKVEEKDDVTYVEAIPINTGREGLVVDKKSHACALCRLNLTSLKYTDVMILSQFIKRDGTMATYHESKLCVRQYTIICGLIKKAQRCNLISRPADYLSPGPWHDFNTYLERDRQRDQPMKVIKKQYWKL